MTTNQSHRAGSGARKTAGHTRNPTLDALRGLAILLMVVDHVAYYWWDVLIAPTTIRIATRLSMPLFSLLMGYFLAGRTNINWHRFYQLCLAAALVNLAFYTAHHKLEILASLLVAYCLFLILGNWLSLAVAAVYLTPWDPTTVWFDYPLPIVVACVAQGMILRGLGWPAALGTGCLITLAATVVAPPSTYVLFYVVPSTLLIAWAAQHPRKTGTAPPLAWLSFLGRYPLTCYLTQYFVVFALSRP